MESVTVSCADLIKKLERNRTKHVALHARAKVGWKVKQVKALRRAIACVQAGKPTGHVMLAKPESHEEEYDRVIGMLRMNRTDKVELTAHDYDCFVRDNWQWSAVFASTSNAYANAAGAARKALKRAR
jgi:hypothetical protein